MHKGSFLVVFALASSAWAAGSDLSGKWEIQSLGSDRALDVQQKGQKFVAHRVMWPEFDGEKYKLEHLYRGTINGSTIKGELLVKEEELPKFEVLRDFTGQIGSDGKIVLDGLPIKRTDGKGGGAPPDAGTNEKRASEAPAMSQATPPPQKSTPAAPAQPPPPPAAAQPPPPPPQDDPGSLFANIMGSPAGDSLFKVSNTVALPDAAADLTAQGDSLYKAGKAKEALVKFEEASKVEGAGGAGLLHRMGRCHLAMKDFKQAKVLLKRALKLDPSNVDLKHDYDRAKDKA